MDSNNFSEYYQVFSEKKWWLLPIKNIFYPFWKWRDYKIFHQMPTFYKNQLENYTLELLLVLVEKGCDQVF